MEPSAHKFATFMSPAAVYATPESKQRSKAKDVDASVISLQSSADRASHPQAIIRWSIDGGEADGTQFFAIPDFARGQAPVRVDIYIPDAEYHPPQLRRALQSDSPMHLESKSVGSSILATHIVAALEHWSTNYQGFQDEYMKLPFGSKIGIENVAASIEDMTIHLMPSFAVEQQMLSKSSLDSLWQLPPDAWPPMIDIASLQLISQPFPTVSLVHIRDHRSQTYVFKSLPDDLKYFYHEIKVLLTLEQHPNIVARPHYLVTKKSRFGGKMGICGFVLTYFPAGTLRDRLSRASLSEPGLRDQLRWARQMTSALIHIHDSALGFYTNLKLNNIVMSETNEGQADPILIDFEQRLGPSSWSPPEVHYISYLAHLASFSPRDQDRSKYTQLLQSLVPGWKKQDKSARYRNPADGYCVPWSAFTKPQQERAQVFMLGKLIWCIFEWTPTLNTAITIDTFREDETDISFPTFRHMPLPLRDLVRTCTSGAMEWEGRRYPVVRCGSRIVVRESDPSKATADVQRLS
jgi:hypothetical protein